MFRQRVTDVGRWRSVFYDPELAALRRQHGLVVSNSCTAEDDPDVIVIILTVADSEKAERFMNTQTLSDFRHEAALTGEPHMQRLGTPVGPPQSSPPATRT